MAALFCVSSSKCQGLVSDCGHFLVILNCIGDKKLPDWYINIESVWRLLIVRYLIPSWQSEKFGAIRESSLYMYVGRSTLY